MPRRLSKDEALDRLASDMPVGACPMCTLLERSSTRFLERGGRVSALLTGFPLAWGHVLVVMHGHTTRFADLDDEVHAEMSAMAHRFARRVEVSLAPARVYVASLGSDREGLAMTTPHLHYHVVPVQERAARPAEVFTWERGIWDGTPAEWDALAEKLLG